MNPKYRLMQALLAQFNGLAVPDQAQCADAVRQCVSLLLPAQANVEAKEVKEKTADVKDAAKK